MRENWFYQSKVNSFEETVQPADKVFSRDSYEIDN